MKRILFGFAMVLLFATMAGAAQVNFAEVHGDGTFFQDGTVGLMSDLTDGYVPAQGSYWQTNTTYFYGDDDQEWFRFDLGGLYSIEDIFLSVDNNDTYTVEYFADSFWWPLFTIWNTYGNVGSGMDTFSTQLGNPYYNVLIDFAAVETRYLAISANHTPSTGDGAFSIGEFQAFGTLIEGDEQVPGAVPEPSTMLLLGVGLAGLAVLRRKFSK